MNKRCIATGIPALLSTAVLAGCGGVSGGAASDDEYPSDTVELVVPFDAGGATDLIARAFAAELEKSLGGATIVVVNKPGASTAVGAAEVANAEPDGHKLFIGTSTTFVTTPMVQEVPYSADDFEGILGIADQPYMVVTAKDSGFQTIEDVAQADNRVTYGVTAIGNNTHLALADFLAESGVKGEAIPFESAQEAVTAAAGGQVDIAAADFNIAAPQVDGGNLTGLAVTSSEPVPQTPDVPTLVSTGVETQPFVGRFALLGPDGMPQDVVDTLVEASQEAVDSAGFQEFVDENYLTVPEYQSGAEWMDEMVPELRSATEHLFDELGINENA